MGSVVVAFAGWQFLSSVLFNPFLIPPPVPVLRTFAPMARAARFSATSPSAWRGWRSGFITGASPAIALGVLMGLIRVLHDLFDPIIELLRYLSPTAMIPIAVIWFGIGEASKYFLIFWGTFFIVVINTVAGVWRTPVARQRAARVPGRRRSCRSS